MQTTVVRLSEQLLKKKAGSCDQPYARAGKPNLFERVKAEMLAFASFLEQGDV